MTNRDNIVILSLSRYLPEFPPHLDIISLKSVKDVTMVAVPAECALGFLAPVLLLLQPIAAQELTNASVGRFLLGRLQWDQFVEVLVHGGRLTIAARGGVGRAVAVMRLSVIVAGGCD